MVFASFLCSTYCDILFGISLSYQYFPLRCLRAVKHLHLNYHNDFVFHLGRRLNLQHREGSICNTPNDLILAQFATQRWLNLQHTKIYKQPFRFNWVGTGLICAHRSDSSVHTTGSWRLICTHTHTHTLG